MLPIHPPFFLLKDKRKNFCLRGTAFLKTAEMRYLFGAPFSPMPFSFLFSLALSPSLSLSLPLSLCPWETAEAPVQWFVIARSCLRPFLSIPRSFAYIAECDLRAGYIPDSQAQAGKFNALIAERLLRAVSRFASATPDSPHLGGGRLGIGNITYSMHSQCNTPVYSQNTHSPNHALVIRW